VQPLASAEPEFENRRGATHRGFESLLLRHTYAIRALPQGGALPPPDTFIASAKKTVRCASPRASKEWLAEVSRGTERKEPEDE